MKAPKKLDLINMAQWFIAAASVLLLFAIWERDSTRDELRIASGRRTDLELQIYREREQHSLQFDGMLDEINRLRGTNATDSTDTPVDGELIDPEPVDEPADRDAGEVE